MALPKNTNLINPINTSVDKSTNKVENNHTENKTAFTLQLIEEGFKNHPSNFIPLEALRVAPEDFFDKYQDIVQNLTLLVQDNISRGDGSTIISIVKKNPVDEEAKSKALQMLNSEFINFENQGADFRYMALTPVEKRLVNALVINQIIGLGPLEPLFQDTRVTEIAVNGPYKIDVEIDGAMERLPAIKFTDTTALIKLIDRLFNSVNKELNASAPLGRARLYNNSRVSGTHRVVAPDGPNLNIRRQSDLWVDPNTMVNWGAASPEIMAYLGYAINMGMSILVVGSTGSGKTTLLSALTGYIPNNKRIVSMERNIEIKIAPSKLHAAPMEEVRSKSSSTAQEVTMRDLVEISTQMRPDVIIVGETTGPEAYDLLNVGNSGHQIFTTIHANSDKDSINRLITLASQTELIKGKALFDFIASAFDLIVVVERSSKDGSRRIITISEVATGTEINEKNNELYLPIHRLWEFKEHPMSKLSNEVKGDWEKVGEISKERQQRFKMDMDNSPNFQELYNLYARDISKL